MTCIIVSRSIGPVSIDAVIREDHLAEMEIAEHPVERGAKISDHAWRKPYSVTMEFVIGRVRARSAYDELLAFQEEAEPFDLVTGLTIYENMLLKELYVERDKEHGQVLKGTAELQEVIIVDTEAGGKDAAANGASTQADSGKGTTKRGQVAARPAKNVPPKTLSILEQNTQGP